MANGLEVLSADFGLEVVQMSLLGDGTAVGEDGAVKAKYDNYPILLRNGMR